MMGTPEPGVSSSMENRSWPESIRSCSQCVIPLCWCHSVLDGWVMAGWLRRWLQQCAARGVSGDSGVPGSPLVSTSWSNSLIIGIYPAASARKHAIMSPYKIKKYIINKPELYSYTLILSDARKRTRQEFSSCTHMIRGYINMVPMLLQARS